MWELGVCGYRLWECTCEKGMGVCLGMHMGIGLGLGCVGLGLGLVSMKGRGLVKWGDVLGSTCERSGLHVKGWCGLHLSIR